MPTLILPILMFVFGTLIGSFLNVLIWRLPRQETITGRSRCPHCSHTLTAAELIPIVSYLRQVGKCVSCGGKISPRYFRIELVTGILFAATAIFMMPSVGLDYIFLFRDLFIIAILIVVFVIDLEHYLILDVIVFPAAIVLLIVNAIIDLAQNQSLLSFSSYTFGGIGAALVAGGIFYILWFAARGRWMGFGDVKFVLLLGLALGSTGTIVGLFLAFMIGAVVGLGLIATGAKQLTSKLPFGTFLSIGALLALWFGPELWHWYRSILGW